MALIPGETRTASGTGIWTAQLPANATIAIDNPTPRPVPPEGTLANVPTDPLFATVKLLIDVKSMATTVIEFLGDSSTFAPNPSDSIGFTARTEIDVVNDTGHSLKGLGLSLANIDPHLPLNLVPGIIKFGHSVNANYAYFTNVQPVSGLTTMLFDPTQKATTATGPAAAFVDLTGPIAAGATVTSMMTLHNTELDSGNNNFVLGITPL